MSVEENKAILRRTIEEANKGNRAALFDLMTSDCIIVDEAGRQFTKQEYEQFWEETLIGVFPDIHVTIENLIAEGDKVVARLTESATMKGDFMGVKATGKKYTAPAIEIWRFANGKLVEHRSVRDNLGAGMQLGWFPQSE